MAETNTPTQIAADAKRLTGQFPNLKPDNPQAFIHGVGRVLSQYPPGVVDECCDPVRGYPRHIEFFSLKSLSDWLDRRVAFYRTFAANPPRVALPVPAEVEYSDEHRATMIERFQALIHGIFSAKETEPYVRPVGAFERPDDDWNRRRAGRPPKAEGQSI